MLVLQNQKGVMKMDNIVEGELLTPAPKKEPQARTMDFIDAIKKIMEGKKVARVSWGNDDYGFMHDGWLSIFTKNAIHTWSVSDGDMEGQDWVMVQEGN